MTLSLTPNLNQTIMTTSKLSIRCTWLRDGRLRYVKPLPDALPDITSAMTHLPDSQRLSPEAIEERLLTGGAVETRWSRWVGMFGQSST